MFTISSLSLQWDYIALLINDMRDQINSLMTLSTSFVYCHQEQKKLSPYLFPFYLIDSNFADKAYSAEV